MAIRKAHPANQSGPRFLRITDIQDDRVDWESVPYCKIESADLPKYRLASGDIVFARTGATTGKSFLVDDPPDAVFASYLIRLRLLDRKLLPKFVSLFFQTSGYWQAIKDGSSGSAQGGFNATKLGALTIPIPPLPEQQRIVGTLDEAFEGIATAKANAEKNLQNARALFESHLQSVFTQRGKGWEQERLGNLCSMGDGNYSSKYPKANEFLPDGVPFLTATNLKDGSIVPDGLRFISSEQNSQLAKGHVRTGDLVVVVRGSKTGNSSFVPEQYSGSNLNSQLAFLRPKERIIHKFLFYSFNSPPIQEKVIREISGAAQPQLPNNKLLGVSVWFPALEHQKTIADSLDSLNDETQRLARLYERKLAALEALKKSLLHQAFAGEL